jgi:capsular polysaccharide biosynthesis protein
VVTVVEEPVPPMSRTSPQRTFIVLIALLFGGVVGVGSAFVRTFLVSAENRDGEREKIEEIRQALTEDGLLRIAQRQIGRISTAEESASTRS